MDIDARIMRAARALLDWEQRDLAREAGLSLGTVQRLEQGAGGKLRPRTAERLVRAFANAGVSFEIDAGTSRIIARGKDAGS